MLFRRPPRSVRSVFDFVANHSGYQCDQEIGRSARSVLLGRQLHSFGIAGHRAGRRCYLPDRPSTAGSLRAAPVFGPKFPPRASALSISDVLFAQRASFAGGARKGRRKNDKDKKKNAGNKGKKRRGGKNARNADAPGRQRDLDGSEPSFVRTPRTPKFMIQEDTAREVPPLFLSTTASPNAYVALSAVEENGIDPNSLFVDCASSSPAAVPPAFQGSVFEYVSPESFGGELPDFGVPEVAFLGRSNVGKSSLINALTGRKDLARISKRPGRTQQVNYFALVKAAKLQRGGKRGGGAGPGGGKTGGDGGPAFRPSDATGYLVDLPGYGYAEAPGDKINDWQRKTQDFLAARRDAGAMCRVYILIDARHGPADFDRAVMGWFDEAEIPYGCILTKCDRVGRPNIVRWTNDTCMRYHEQMYGGGGVMSPIVHVTSSTKRDGIEELMWSIEGDFDVGREAMKIAKGKEGWGNLTLDEFDEEFIEGEDMFGDDSDDEDEQFRDKKDEY